MDPKAPAAQQDTTAAGTSAPTEHAAYPRLSPEDVAPPPPPVVPPAGANPYVVSAPSPNPPAKSESDPRLMLSSLYRSSGDFGLTASCSLIVVGFGSGHLGILVVAGARENLREMFGSVGKKFNEAARKTEGIAGDVWQHLKTGPSFTDAAMGRIAQISKVISEGGYEKIFQQTFECLPDEKLKKAYVCYLSTLMDRSWASCTYQQ
ncbi:hypothetical protein PR202_gb21687 [Eleusine coracana subsp. coracana]|uniref:Uncharacterized protein n=1 Tax=Eleusine coracana subsp. coracana TaxID=191504 RepID=A0AAV5FFS3_ELECO|nr:hypothetical protein PR202_gb21687 [Eleusine coracana subsp. coracana]